MPVLTGWAGVDPTVDAGGDDDGTDASAGSGAVIPAEPAPAASAAVATAGGTTVTQSPEGGVAGAT
jgi:hypothetical protein